MKTKQTFKPLTDMTNAEMVAEYNALTSKSIKKFSSRAAGERQLNDARLASLRTAAIEAATPVDQPLEKKPGKTKKEKSVWPFGTPTKVDVATPAKPKTEKVQAKVEKQPTKNPYNYTVDGCPTCKATQDQTAASANDGSIAAEERNFCHHCLTEYWRNTGKVYKTPKVSVDRSKAISETWNNPATAAKRTERHHVKVVGGDEYRSVLEAFKTLRLPISKHIKFRMELKASATRRATFEHDGAKTQFILVTND